MSSVLIRNKSLPVEIKTSALDFATEATLGAVSDNIVTAGGKIDSVKDKLTSTNLKLDDVVSKLTTGIAVTMAVTSPATGQIFSGATTGVLPAGTASATVTPSATLVTIFGKALNLPDGAVTFTVQFSNDDSVYYDSSNSIVIAAPGDSFEMTFWVAAPYFHCVVDKSFQLQAFYAAR